MNLKKMTGVTVQSMSRKWEKAFKKNSNKKVRTQGKKTAKGEN